MWSLADRGARRQEAALPVKDPGLHAGRSSAAWRSRRASCSTGRERAAAPVDAGLLAVHESPPLRCLVRDMLLYSNNLMAELIGLSAAARLGDDRPTSPPRAHAADAPSRRSDARGRLAGRRARQPLRSRRRGPADAASARRARALRLARSGPARAAAGQRLVRHARQPLRRARRGAPGLGQDRRGQLRQCARRLPVPAVRSPGGVRDHDLGPRRARRLRCAAAPGPQAEAAAGPGTPARGRPRTG